MIQKIALLAGGYTGESVISFKSAETVLANLDTSLYEVHYIHVLPEIWFYVDEKGNKFPVDKTKFTVKTDTGILQFDKVFIIIHGTPGEDGKLQGYFDMLEIPYNTCGAMISALTMNKSFTKSVISNNPKIHLAKSILLYKEEDVNLDIFADFVFPLFVKTNTGGSSIGMSKVEGLVDMKNALDKAFKEDDQVIVEEFIEGREFTIGVYSHKGKIIALPPTEIISKKEFFDFEAKYTPGMAQEITPANLSPSDLHKLKEVAMQVYKSLHCKGIVRVDFIQSKNTGEFVFLELNTVPGQSAASIIPQQVEAAGISLKDFYTILINESSFDK